MHELKGIFPSLRKRAKFLNELANLEIWVLGNIFVLPPTQKTNILLSQNISLFTLPFGERKNYWVQFFAPDNVTICLPVYTKKFLQSNLCKPM